MGSLLWMPKFQRLESWRDPEDEGRLHSRVLSHPKSLVLPPEYEAYRKRFGRIYRIEASESRHSWILSMDFARRIPQSDANLPNIGRMKICRANPTTTSYIPHVEPWGWDQNGYYVCTLLLRRNGSIEAALERAIQLLPDEAAFWVNDGAIDPFRTSDLVTVEELPGDVAFEKWFRSL